MTTTTAEKDSVKAFGDTTGVEPQENITEDLQARVSSKVSPQPATTKMPTTIADTPAATDGLNSVAPLSTAYNDVEKSTETTKETEKPTGPLAARPEELEATETKVIEKPTEKPSEKTHATIKDAVAVAPSKEKLATIEDGSATKVSSLPLASAKPAESAITKPGTARKEPAMQITQVVSPPTTKPALKPALKPAPKPAPVATTPSTAQKRSGTAKPPVTLTKRTAEPSTSTFTTPDAKRARTTETLPTPTTPTILSRISPGTPSPRPFSIERKVAEQRKKLESLRLKRIETAKKQVALDKKMEPYKQRLAEELERLDKEMMEEEAAAAEDDEHFNASVEMYEELRKGEESV
jgi:hypothetical protein